MDVQRSILIFSLVFVCFLIYQKWLEEYAPPPPPAPTGETADQRQVPPQPTERDVPTVPSTTGLSVPEPATLDMPKSTGQVVVTTNLLRATIDPNGGRLVRIELLEYPTSVAEGAPPVALLQTSSDDLFISQSGLIGSGREFPNHKTPYQTEAKQYTLKEGATDVTARLTWTAPDGIVYSKLFTFKRDSYVIDISFDVDNRSATPWQGYLYAQFLRNEIVPSRGFFLDVVPSYLGGAIFTPEEKFDKISFSDMRDADLARETDAGWVAMLQHYFVAAWLPTDAGQKVLYTAVHGRNTPLPTYNIGIKTAEPLTIEPRANGRLSIQLFAGPKEQDRLNRVAEGFSLTVDYGWLTPVSAPLFWVLEKIHTVVGNWGWAIIIVTCLIKLAFYPLSAASYKSMAKMKKLQPRLQTLKERYGDDRAKLNQAMMELYKKDKVNPLGGCLPILIQIPVFIALYWVLLESVELRQAPFILWLQDLSVKDPYFVLPILMGATMVAQQFLNPAPLDPIQKKIMMAMPIVFTFLFLYFPAGLVLYWLVNNVLSIAQQWYINKTIAS